MKLKIYFFLQFQMVSSSVISASHVLLRMAVKFVKFLVHPTTLPPKFYNTIRYRYKLISGPLVYWPMYY